MVLSEEIPEEPVTPSGRLFLRPELDTIIHCIIGFDNPIDLAALRSAVKSSVLFRDPKFRSVVVRDRDGIERWRLVHVDFDRHFIVVPDSLTQNDDVGVDFTGDGTDGVTNEIDTRAVNEYVSNLSVSCPLNKEYPLWEIHVLVAHRCVVFRIHHALGDGVALISNLLESCSGGEKKKKKEESAAHAPPKKIFEEKRVGLGRWVERAWKVVMVMLLSCVFVVEFVLRSLWVRDGETSIAGGDGVELWPRRLATAGFLIEDMKLVKAALPNATINDVLLAVISSGLSRYLDNRSPNGLHKPIWLTGVSMVNLRKQPVVQESSEPTRGDGRLAVGNKFGIFLLPIHCRKDVENPLDYLKSAKAMLDKKKLSLEAHFSYNIGDLVMSWFGPKYAFWLNNRILCNTSFTISNVIGPREDIEIAGNRVRYLRATTSSLPNALTMHMVSYSGKADLQISVAKDIIPDPKFLAKCFEDALIELKEAAVSHRRLLKS